MSTEGGAFSDGGTVVKRNGLQVEQLDLPLVMDAPPFPHLPPTPRDKGRQVSRSLLDMATSTLEYGRYASLGDLMTDVGRLRQHKPFNALLALLQLPAASYLLPAHRWQNSYRRRIRPGQQPIVLLLPKGPVMFVFDVSQTEGTATSRPLPSGMRNPFEMRDAAGADEALTQLANNVKADGVRFHPAREGFSRAGCIWPVTSDKTQSASLQRDITVEFPVRYESLFSDAFSPTERLATIAHELGHLYCGHVGTISEHRWPDRRYLSRNVMEREAESVARVVFGRMFPDVDMPPYRDMPPDNALPDLQDLSLKLVMDAASWILQDTIGPRRHLPEREYDKSRVAWPFFEEPAD